MMIRNHALSPEGLRLELVGTQRTTTPSAPGTRGFHYNFRQFSAYLPVLYSKLRIAVIYGGDRAADGAVIYRTVNPRPWKSYKSVACDICNALKENGFEQVITLPDDMHLAQRLKDEGIHLAWLNTAGVQGYSSVSHAAAALEMLGIPYIGHNPHDATMLDNKDNFKRVLQALGIQTAPFITWHPAKGDLLTGENSRFRAVFGEYGGPFVIKPVSGRASLHISVVESAAEVVSAAGSVFRATRNDVLIEKFLPGREFCVAVCGPVIGAGKQFAQTHQPFAFSAVERVLEDYELIFTSMDTRAITGKRIRPVGEQDQNIKEALVQLAQQIYHELNLGYLVRLDVRADAEGVLHVLEANPKPDLTREHEGVGSVVALGLRECALRYDDLIMSLVADRLHYLFTYNPGCVSHVAALLA